ncbi:hypothetical protein RYH73_19165 [Olivibacter sp. CPCC 100613]
MTNIKILLLIRKYQRLVDHESNAVKVAVYRSVLEDLLDLLE